MAPSSLHVSYSRVRAIRALVNSAVAIYAERQADDGCCFDDDEMMFSLKASDLNHNISMIKDIHTEMGNPNVWHSGEKPDPALPAKPRDVVEADWQQVAIRVTQILKESYPHLWLNNA